MELSFVIALTLGFAAGALVGWLASRSSKDRLQFELEKERVVHAERLKAYHEAEARLREAFKSMSAEALQTNNRSFLDLAETRLREARAETTADMDARRKATEALVAPLAKVLEQVDHELKDSDRRRIESGTALMERIASLDTLGRDLRGETARLVDALKRPGVRGRWGELQLKRVLELAGMLERCDFDEQQTITAVSSGSERDQGDRGDRARRMRPDVVIHLAGGKHVVVDAKAPLDAYLKALEAPDEAARQTLLADHARQVRTHLAQLSAKDYAANVYPSPEFVVMFLPGEMFFSAALEQDPSLIEFGVGLRVILASPTTLIALLRVVAYGWQQEAMEENARKISELGRGLYDSVQKLGDHFDALGRRLRSVLESYNQAVGSLEGNVLVKARKFKELQTANSSDEIKPLEPIDRVPRMLQARELTDALPFAEPTLGAPEIRD